MELVELKVWIFFFVSVVKYFGFNGLILVGWFVISVVFFNECEYFFFGLNGGLILVGVVLVVWIFISLVIFDRISVL